MFRFLIAIQTAPSIRRTSRRVGGSFLFAFSLMVSAIEAKAACVVPNTIANGQVADASVVMDDLNAIAACVDSVSANSVTTTGTNATGSIAVFSGAKTITSANLSGDLTTTGGTAAYLVPSGVTAGTYVNPTITIDTKGRVTAASSTTGQVGASAFFPTPLNFALTGTFNGYAATTPGGGSASTNFNVVPSNISSVTRMPRYGIGGSLGANGFAQVRSQQNLYLVPASTTVAFGMENVPTGARILAGYHIGWSGGTEVSASPTVFGLGKDSTDSNMQIIARNNNGTVTKINLGPNFPGNGSGFGYVAKFTVKTDGTVDYQVTHLVTGASASGNISTGIPNMTLSLVGGVWFGSAIAQTVQGSIIGFEYAPTLQ